MRAKRLIWFLIFIALGVAGGISYGWSVNPVKFVNTSFNSLRSDYKADYVLMVAEAYKHEGDLELARLDLQSVSEDEPAAIVEKAMETGKNLGYSESDQEILSNLLIALKADAQKPQATP